MAGNDDFDLWLGHVGTDRSIGSQLARARRMGGAASAKARRFPVPP